MQEVTYNVATGETTFREITPEEIAKADADALPQWRANATCSRMQGILAVGEAQWAKIIAYRDGASWGEQVTIDEAGDWSRNSQNIAFFGYLLGMDDTAIDAAFQTAASIVP